MNSRNRAQKSESITLLIITMVVATIIIVAATVLVKTQVMPQIHEFSDQLHSINSQGTTS